MTRSGNNEASVSHMRKANGGRGGFRSGNIRWARIVDHHPSSANTPRSVSATFHARPRSATPLSCARGRGGKAHDNSAFGNFDVDSLSSEGPSCHRSTLERPFVARIYPSKGFRGGPWHGRPCEGRFWCHERASQNTLFYITCSEACVFPAFSEKLPLESPSCHEAS